MPFNSWAVVFWQLPHLKRHGWHCVEVENMVPPVNIVQDLLHKAFSTVGGGRYEESAQERALLLQQLQNSELGRNVCPVSVCHHAVAPDPETAKSGR